MLKKIFGGGGDQKKPVAAAGHGGGGGYQGNQAATSRTVDAIQKLGEVGVRVAYTSGAPMAGTLGQHRRGWPGALVEAVEDTERDGFGDRLVLVPCWRRVQGRSGRHDAPLRSPLIRQSKQAQGLLGPP